MVLDRITANGHRNLLCTHNTTIELTKDNFLTKRGNCILGVNATKACKDLTKELKDYIQKGKEVIVILKSNEIMDSFYGFGHRNLTLIHERDIVFRKSDYICNRTALIKCSKSSAELSKELIEDLKDPNNKIRVILKRVK